MADATGPTVPAGRTEARLVLLVDAVAALLALLAACVALTGGFRLQLGPLSISALSWKRLALEAAVVFVLRHGLVRAFDRSGARCGALVLAYVFLLLALVASSTPRRVGDGHEYLAMALNLSGLRPPSVADAEMRDIERTFASLGAGFEGVPLVNPDLRGRDGRQDFVHFWFYPLLAAPWVWAARAAGLPPSAAFTFVNVLLLAVALWVVCRRVRRDVALLAFAGPILWWADKAHTEAFTFALLAIATTLAADAPWWSLVALGAAGTQNPAIALALPLVVLAALAARGDAWRDHRLWLGAAAGAALSAVPLLYYWARLGRLSPLLGITTGEVPSLRLWSAPLIDLNVGILVNFPWLTLALLAAVAALAWRAPRRLRDPAVLLSLAAAILFLTGFAQVPNVHHGGSPGISRYGLWMIPLTLPVLALCDGIGGRPRLRWLGLVAAISCLWCVRVFHPAHQGDRPLPTALAEAVWTRYPWADNPLPEIFTERAPGRGDVDWLPVAMPGCEKVLLLGDGRDELAWPIPCRPAPAPASCLAEGALCYANRSEDGYTFVHAPRQTGFVARSGEVWRWTVSSAPRLQQALGELDWPGLRVARFTYPAPMVRRFDGIAWVYMLKSAHQFIVYASAPAVDAVVRVEIEEVMDGRIVDAATGATLQLLGSLPAGVATIAVPGPRGDALIVLTSARP